MSDSLTDLITLAKTRHACICPRLILGLRLGLYAGELLNLPVPQSDKRLITFVETNGCGADGIAIATGCHVGGRTLHVFDFGKVAATIVDSHTEYALRFAPLPQARHHAKEYATDQPDSWHAQLYGYQHLPATALFSVQPVTLNFSLTQWISRPGLRALCQKCHEEIMNEREVFQDGLILCRSCAGEAYYHPSL